MTATESEWKPFRVVDAFATSPTQVKCDSCSRKLRWVHWLHDGNGNFAKVGVCCALKICGAYDARAAERNAINRSNRLRTFLKPEKWKQSRKNPANVWRNVLLTNSVSVCVIIFEKRGLHGVVIARSPGNDITPFERFGDREAAMRFAFELIEGLRINPP
jgi:hypothetical protein